MFHPLDFPQDTSQKLKIQILCKYKKFPPVIRSIEHVLHCLDPNTGVTMHSQYTRDRNTGFDDDIWWTLVYKYNQVPKYEIEVGKPNLERALDAIFQNL